MIPADQNVALAGPEFSEGEMDDHLDRLRREHPELHRCVDVERARTWSAEFAQMDVADDFGVEDHGGRGESYLRAQTHNVTARARGIAQLLSHLRAGAGSSRLTVVDVLGGDGLVGRVAAAVGMSDITVLTCDLSPYMVRAAWSAGCPALLQRADRLLQRNGSVDGVLVAYGSHHISPVDRAAVVREAHRVLRPGGALVLHDFLVGSPMDRWFSEVVDPYSRTGHRFEHFTREALAGYLADAGFAEHEVVDMADPYVATAATAVAAELGLGRYLLYMYGLARIDRLPGTDARRWALDRARDIFRGPGPADRLSVRLDERTRMWRCTAPRTALVGIGRKAP